MKKVTHFSKAFITLSIASLVILTACGGKSDEFAKQDDSNQTVKIVKTDKKEDKSGSQESSDKSFQSEASENTEKTVDSSAPVENSVSKASDTQITQGGGTGGAVVTSGRLTLWEDTPVYSEPNKSGEVVFTKAKDTSVDWDNYFQENGDWWYSFVDNSSGQEIRCYIAYSDVKH